MMVSIYAHAVLDGTPESRVTAYYGVPCAPDVHALQRGRTAPHPLTRKANMHTSQQQKHADIQHTPRI